MPEDADVKEVAMDAPQEDGTRKRRRRRGRRATAKQDAESDATVVEKADAPSVESKPEAPKPVAAPMVAAKPPVVVLAPAKKKVPKVMLVPKRSVTVAKTLKKPFAAKRVHVVIDNTAKTQKRRRQTMQRVDAMTDDQVRASAVGSKLAKRETVAKVPISLLRQMVKDYYTMRGMLL
jgi:hypothetical protein